MWRRTRPFWGGLLVIVAASEMLVSERDPLPVVTHIGIQGLAGYLIPTFILLCGVLLWSIPNAWIYYSLLAILLGLGSWITSNLGGFFIGMLIDVIGGALAFAWTTDADYGSSGWLRGKPPGGLPSWALEVISRLRNTRRRNQKATVNPRTLLALPNPQLSGPSVPPALTAPRDRRLRHLDESGQYGLFDQLNNVYRPSSTTTEVTSVTITTTTVSPAKALERLHDARLAQDDLQDAAAAAGDVLAEVTGPTPDGGKIRRALSSLKGFLSR